MSGYVHHVEWSVRDLDRVRDLLVDNYGFVLHARRSKTTTATTRQEVVRYGSCMFLLSEKKTTTTTMADQPSVYPVFETGSSHDTVFNVVMAVEDVDAVTRNASSSSSGAEVLLQPRTIETEKDGSIRISAVRSCVGNVVHAIVDPRDFRGHFLPGFEEVAEEDDEEEEESLEVAAAAAMIDHVSIVCPPGHSEKVLTWYARSFGMERFLVNPTENVEEGFVIGNEVGLRLKVAEWMTSWLCSEDGIQFPQSPHPDKNLKLVLAEPLENSSQSHVQKFLDEHGGPGVQHIGIRVCGGVEDKVEEMTRRGANFRKPPPTYYKMDFKRQQIVDAGFSPASFERLGLLLDSEKVDDDDAKEDGGGQQQRSGRFLVQIFTKPIFDDRDTFFLEVLERKGARGFGEGNITALARSILVYQEEQQQLKLQQQQGQDRRAS